MNVSDYTYLMNKPGAITEKQVDALGSVLNEFPYFQSARALRLKGLYNQKSFKYNYALKVTAAHTTDRSVLFDFITSESFTSIQNQFYDAKIHDLSAISVYGSEIVSSEEFKKIIEVRIDPVEQSILDSIKEATGLVSNENIKTEEQLIEQSVLNPEKEIETIVERPIEIEDRPIESKSILVDAPVFYEEPVTEKNFTHQIIEQPVAILQEEVPFVFKEIDEKPFHSTEEPKIIVVPDTTAVVWEEIQKSVEVVIDPIIEDPAITAKETATIVFEEAQKTDEVTIDLIEESDMISVPDTTAVVWEESKTVYTTKYLNITDNKELINEPLKNAEENLEIGKPLDFSANEKHSFQEWLQLARTEAIDRTVDITKKNVKETEKTPEPAIETHVRTETVDEQKRKKEEIINNFIKTNPKIPPIKQTAIVPTVQLDSNNEENSYLMTETLARVYLEQKKYTKAIQAYEILILKYPEKISFFADRISDIKILQQNNNNN
ncbi:hypothetical protein [Flavobacterium sp.]|uniref:tetratricopeptide repeat protein n=1 Tax=Flavobacterium sp. TaxID=239 RepID=UPI0032639EDD